MSIVKKIVVGILVLIVVLVAVGFLLPRQFKVERSAQFNVPPEKVYPFIAQPSQWPKWGVWNRRDPGMKVSYGGPMSGAGAKWSWESKSEGNGAMEFTAAEENKRIAYRLTFPDFGMESIGELTLASADGKTTTITWNNRGDLGINPLSRYFGLFMDGMAGKDFEGGLANLKVLAEQTR